MKKIMIVVALIVSTIGFAQRKELRKIEKAIENEDFSEAKNEFQQIVEKDVEEKYLADYKFYNAVVKLGDPKSPSLSDQEAREMIFLLKEAEDLGYEEKSKINSYRQIFADAILKNAQAKLASGNQKAALEDVKYISSLYPDNDKMRENLANLAYGIAEYDTAASNYESLIENGYTGEEESILATNVSTGQTTSFPNKEAAEFGVLSGEYKDVRTETADSQLGPIVSNLAWIYKNNDQISKAKSLFDGILAKYPDDISLKASTPDIYLILDMNDEYEDSFKELQEDIKDPRVFENLGIGAAAKEEWLQAINYYKKSLELESNNYPVQNNIAVAYLNLANLEKTSADDQKIYYKSASQHLETVVEMKPELSSVKQTLIGLYDFLDMKEKAAAMKAKM
jgi:Flp pilus assembly protein TadD